MNTPHVIISAEPEFMWSCTFICYSVLVSSTWPLKHNNVSPLCFAATPDINFRPILIFFSKSIISYQMLGLLLPRKNAANYEKFKKSNKNNNHSGRELRIILYNILQINSNWIKTIEFFFSFFWFCLFCVHPHCTGQFMQNTPHRLSELDSPNLDWERKNRSDEKYTKVYAQCLSIEIECAH